ncbi:GT-D fold domain-containing glycosyltransferase [Glutamicibacter creatinolyticus]|uniref:GT-D fold domain-containing glycosyltransferase n=1 Tax=Glutamicibacter creatinolyticus TaxID=162496 RepID=UPI0031E1AE5E
MSRAKDIARDLPSHKTDLQILETLQEVRDSLRELDKKISESQDRTSTVQLEKNQFQTLERIRVITENSRMAALSPLRAAMKRRITDHQLGLVQTLHHLAETGKSFSRFGDGEFRLMFRPEFDLRFQKNSAALAADLREVLSTPSEHTMLGLPHIFYDVHWSTVLAELWHELDATIPEGVVFGDAHVSRPPVFTINGQEGIDAWRAVWEGKNVAVVAGKGSRFDLIDPLFDNIASVQRIDSLPTNAYSDLGRVSEEVEKSGADVVLVALGPAGTILSNRLATSSRQVLDIGHLTASYRAVYEGASQPESRPLIARS